MMSRELGGATLGAVGLGDLLELGVTSAAAVLRARAAIGAGALERRSPRGHARVLSRSHTGQPEGQLDGPQAVGAPTR